MIYWRIVWTKTDGGPFHDGNYFGNINEAFRHMQIYVNNYGWEGHIVEAV